MRQVQTVTGPIEPGALGSTLMHEHFLFGFCGFQGDSTLGPLNREEAMEYNVAAAKRAMAYGVRTVVDATTNECGRDPVFLQELSRRTGLNILCATGYYYESESAFAYWNFRSSFANIEEEIAQMMMAELTGGIGGTGIRAGVIKLASSEGWMTPMEEVFFRAGARASRETGAPIITHTQAGTMGTQQARLLLECGAAPEKIAIGHMCGSTDVDYHEAVLRQGVYDAFDRFGLEGGVFRTPTDRERVAVLAGLIRRGWEDRLLLSHDSVTVELGRPRPVPREQLDFMKHAHIGNLGERVIPMMLEAGITRRQVEKMLVDNPARLLG